MDRVCPLNRLHTGFRQAKMAYLARNNQLFDRACDFLDGHIWVHAMLIEQIDTVCPQALQAGVRNGSDVFGPAICTGASLAGRGIDVETELRCDYHVVTNRFKSFPYKFLVREGAISFRGVEVSHTTIVSGAK